MQLKWQWLLKKNPDDDLRIETRVGVTIYNKNYKKVVLCVH
jgi:hypothetical protein